jgi:hypothetical protein
MDPITPKDYIDARCGELRAEHRADLAEIKSMIESKLDNIPTTRTFLGGLAGAVVTIVALILTVLAYAGERTDAGIGIGATLQRVQASADATSAAVKDMANAQGRAGGLAAAGASSTDAKLAKP